MMLSQETTHTPIKSWEQDTMNFVSKIEMKQGMTLLCSNIRELSNKLSLQQAMPHLLNKIFFQSLKSYAYLMIFVIFSIATQMMQMMTSFFSYSFSRSIQQATLA